MKKKIPGILFGILFLIGFGILIYPTAADQWNTYRQSRLISSYEAAVEKMEPEDFSLQWEKARAFNDSFSINNIYGDIFGSEEQELTDIFIIFLKFLHAAGGKPGKPSGTPGSGRLRFRMFPAVPDRKKLNPCQILPFQRKAQKTVLFPVAESAHNILFRTGKNIGQRGQGYLSFRLMQTAQNIQIYFYKFSVRLRHIIVYKKIRYSRVAYGPAVLDKNAAHTATSLLFLMQPQYNTEFSERE